MDNQKWEWTDELAIEFSVFCMKFDANNNNQYLDAFKLSKQPKRDWQIAAIGSTFHNDPTLLFLQKDGRYGTSENAVQFTFKELSENQFGKDYYIHSVRRLSDGEVFTVGDRISNNAAGEYTEHTIKHFAIADSVGRMECWVEAGYYNIVDISKAPKPKPLPILTTEDGVDIFKGEIFYGVKLSRWSVIPDVRQPHTAPYDKDYKYFSTKEKAEEWVLWNRPVLTLEDIKSLCAPKVFFDNMEFSMPKLINLAKSKIDKQ